MAWVRYDDQFSTNAKVTAVVADDAGALALHVLANTWTNGQKRPGFVPAHQPGILVCDKTQGAEWARVLVAHGLWHHSDHLDLCASCSEEYGDLPEDVKGYVFHNAALYRAPERDRTKPGTSAELSEKRREAGRRGGRAAAAKKRELEQQEQHDAPLPPAPDDSKDGNLLFGGVSKTSNLSGAGVTPVPEPVVASSEATEQRPSGAVADKPRSTQTSIAGGPPDPPLRVTQRSKLITDAYSLAEPMCKWPAVNNIVIKAIKAEKWTDAEIQDAVLRLAADKRGVTVDTLRIELDGLPAPKNDHKTYQNPPDQSVYDEELKA